MARRALHLVREQIPYVPISTSSRGYRDRGRGPRSSIIVASNEGTSDWKDNAKTSVPYLKYLLNVDPGHPTILAMDPLARRAGIFDALRHSAVPEHARPSCRARRRGPALGRRVISQDALGAIVDVIASVPILMILTHRPRRQAAARRTRALQPDRARTSGPLRTAQAMAGQVLKARSLPTELEELITEQERGQHFYIEELTKSLLE